MTGIEGRMSKPLAAAVIAAVAASLVLALTLVPVAAGLLLRPRPKGTEEEVAIIRAIKRRYAALLDWCMAHAGLVRVLTLAITIPALALAFVVGSDFMPELDEGAFLVQTILPSEASLEEVDRLNHRLEDLFRWRMSSGAAAGRSGRKTRCRTRSPTCWSC